MAKPLPPQFKNQGKGDTSADFRVTIMSTRILPGCPPPGFGQSHPIPGKAPKCNQTSCTGKISRFQRFANASNAKLVLSSMTRGRPEKLPKWKSIPAWSDSGALAQLQYARRIAVDIKIKAQDLPATSCTIFQGVHRLRAPLASKLVSPKVFIMKSATRLHACESSDLMHLCDLIYIIGLGLPVVMASTWRLVAGQPSRLASNSGIVLHAPAAILKPCTFMLSRALRTNHPDLFSALDYCEKQPKSQWVVVKDKGQILPLVANAVKADSISQLADAILKMRTLQKDACRAYSLALA